MLESLRSDRPLVLVGSGNMGGALLRRWLSTGIDPNAICIVDPRAEELVGELHPGPYFRSAFELPSTLHPRVVLIAVKPQVVPSVLPELSQFSDPTLFISIVAGTPIAAIEAALGASARVIRAMPNTPAGLGKGITAWFPNARTSESDVSLTRELFSAAGAVVALSTEKDFDAVTALSGSGPAYFFLLAEAMAEAGETLGLGPEIARQLSEATLSGAGALMEAGEESAENLRRRVTSPKGTTAAALDVLMRERRFADLVEMAMKAAAKRSSELSHPS